jgi:hypothetical protein
LAASPERPDTGSDEAGLAPEGAAEEAVAAAAWWAGALDAGPGLGAERVAVFERMLAGRIEALCQDAGWQPEVPTYGTCGRQVTSSPRPDGALARAARWWPRWTASSSGR